MKNNFKIKLEHKDGSYVYLEAFDTLYEASAMLGWYCRHSKFFNGILYIEDTDAKYDEVGNEKEGGC